MKERVAWVETVDFITELLFFFNISCIDSVVWMESVVFKVALMLLKLICSSNACLIE